MTKVKKIVSKIREGFLKKAVSEFFWIYNTLAEYRWQIIFYTLLILVSSGISLSFSLQSKRLVDSLVAGTWSGVAFVAAYYVVAGSMNVGLSMLSQRISAKVNSVVKKRLSIKTFRKILCADWETIIEHHSGDLMARMQEDIGTISESTVGWIPSLLAIGLQLLISIVIIVYYDYTMIFVIVLVAPIILISSRFFLGKLYVNTQKQREMSSDIMGLYKEAFQHLQSIKGFGLISLFDEKMQKKQNERQQIDLEANKYAIASWSVMYISGQVAALVCLAWVLYHVYLGIISLGTMTLLIAMALNVATNFKSLIQLIPAAIGTISSSERVRILLELQEEVIEGADDYKKLNGQENDERISLSIKGMSFHYKNGKKVFENVSCYVNSGEIVAFVGPSVEGKTTMLRILLGIVKAEGECVFVTNGGTMPITTASRKLMAYVPQGNTMLNGTIADNLRMLKPDATDEEIIQALKEACAYEFVELLPEGIHQKIGESGLGFSEGQNQRLAIARALMCRTPILLLDEATSALDVATERRVLASLMKGWRQRTCILTTHRPSVLNMCDRVYRIANKEIKEVGDTEIQKIMDEF